jgi:hypothetical protein
MLAAILALVQTFLIPLEKVTIRNTNNTRHETILRTVLLNYHVLITNDFDSIIHSLSLTKLIRCKRYISNISSYDFNLIY